MATRTGLLAVVTVFAACGSVDPLAGATLQLNWRVAPAGCEAAGVEVVEVRATGPHAVLERVACGRGGLEIGDMTPGTYRVEVLGFDPNGVATFRADSIYVDLEADEVATTPELRLLAAPADVLVRWTFANGRVCGANEARWISISAFDEFDYEVAAADFPCDDGAGHLPALRAGSYLIQATALDAATNPVSRGTAPTKLSRGQTAELDLDLAPL